VKVREISEALGLDEDTCMELLTLFHETTVADLEKMESALKAGSARGVADAAHSIKGAAANLRLREISEIAKEIEMEGRQDFLDHVEGGMTVLKGKLSLVEAMLRHPD
jgi:HPt (histidine-containing phosphotransfer) domain-containing protein